MYVSKKILALVAGLVVVGAMIGAMGWLFVEMAQANAALDRANAQVAKGNEVITSLNDQVAQGNATIESLNGEVVKANEINTSLNAEVAKGNDIIDSLNEEVGKGNETIAGLVDANEEWETQFNILNATYRSLQTEHGRLQGQYNTLNSNHRALQSSHNVLQGQHERLRGELSSLEATYGTLQDVRREIADGKKEVDGLADEAHTLSVEVEAMRRDKARLLGWRAPDFLGSPGHHNTSRSGFNCTGSMTPALTCMDEALWLDNFRPQDVMVGATISFNPASCWEAESADNWISHRVIDIKIENGIHYYWPKGDSNFLADGCWVPEHQVDGYIIRLERNARPANAELHRLMFAAKSALYEAQVALYALRDQHCERFDEDCTIPWSVYDRFEELWEAREAAWELYDCWAQVAKDSRYPGHIPRRC